MLHCLRIKNLAVIDDLTWELEPGFNILTGETGAGKSILVDAFNLLLGERADKTLIRDGAESCTVEAILDAPAAVANFLAEQGIEPNNEDGLILKRTFTAQSQNRQFINGSPTTLQVLKSLGDFLVDMHGPHDHQSLLSTDAQLAALDSFAKIDLAEYQKFYREQLRDQSQLTELQQAGEHDLQTKLDFLQFQISEIEQANLNPEEESSLEHEYQIASNRRRITEIAGNIRQLLSEGESDVYGKLEAMERLLQDWEKIDPAAANLRELNQGALTQLRELETEAENLIEQTELDAARLQEIETRINLLQTLRRKYGSNIPDILAKLEELKNEHHLLVSREETIQKLRSAIEERNSKLEKLSNELTKLRKIAAPKLAADITQQLRQLGFKQSDFSIKLSSQNSLASTGKDVVEFFFAPNPGESARPLRAIASSGEMARVMLAVKTVLAKQDKIPILIFDEIDANIGGETAVAVGKKLRELTKSHQVLCITHLPQVAASGNTHYRVEKKIKSGRTMVQIEMLDAEGRVEELSRMLGGQNKSSHALAETLLSKNS